MLSISGQRQKEEAQKVDEALERSGAKWILEVGLGDDDQCIEDDFTAWKEKPWPELDGLLKDEDAPSTPNAPYRAAVAEYRVVVYEPGTQVFVEDYAAKKNGQVVYDALHPCKSEVVFVKEFGKVESTEVAPEATETPTETEKIVEVATETPTETEKIVEVATEAPAASVDKAAVETVVEELQAKVGKENVVVSKRLEEQQKYLNLPTTTIGCSHRRRSYGGFGAR
jgi:hypothetical protein